MASAALLSRGYGVSMITRREFIRFFIIGSIVSLFSKKVKAEEKPKEAMFWRKLD